MKIRVSIIIFTLFLLISCSPKQTPIRVAVASSLLVPMTEIADSFQVATGHSVQVLSASSGVHTAQIKNHAPFHIFLSANQTYPQFLFEDGFTQRNPQTLVLGEVAIWSRIPFVKPEDIFTSNLQKIAMANPELAPFGEAAQAWLQQKNRWTEIQPKLVFAENIGQTNHFIHSGTVDVAFTSSSAISAPELAAIGGQWQVLTDAGKVPHDVVLLKTIHPHADEFYEFLFSEKAQKIFGQFGYSTLY